MHRSVRAPASALMAGLFLAPGTLAAHEPTPDQVAAAFSQAGFEVEPATEWTWLSPPHASLRVHDRTAGRILLVLVYRDTATAAEALLDGRVRLVPGYGPSSWHANVALMQASQRELDRWFATESARSVGMSAITSDRQSASEAGSASVVAAEFLAALDSPVAR